MRYGATTTMAAIVLTLVTAAPLTVDVRTDAGVVTLTGQGADHRR